ncbi:MAG: four-carbon acid sugar kinase family protein [Eubacteriales bacterium]|jgi:uncharacterized protein YgbK (DUF1537 family)
MLNLLVIADDLTGALDTAVQFSAFDVQIRITLIDQLSDDDFSEGILVVDTETRHMTGEDAYRVVYELVERAVEQGVTYIYKKTDSVLRGNSGAELAAVLNASRLSKLHFIPAFPRTGRITLGGIQYVNGIPISESDFRNDPVDPVTESSIKKILRRQTDLPIILIPSGENIEKLPDGILVYDVQSQQQMEMLAGSFNKQNDFLFAGCAGMAETMPKILELQVKHTAQETVNKPVIVINGSPNPVSVNQCDHAESVGIPRFRLMPEQKLNGNWISTPEADNLVLQITRSCAQKMISIVDVNDSDKGATNRFALEMGMSSENVRMHIIELLGRLVKKLLDTDLDCIVFIMGGDSLLGMVRGLEISRLGVLGQISPGVVLSQFYYRGKRRYLLSKSGGFGEPELFSHIQRLINDGGLHV